MSHVPANAEAPLILVAHESDTIREAIRHLLADAGYRVRTVGNGREAVGALEGATAVVLDVAVPEVHAYEVVEQAKGRTPAPRVVLVASIYNRMGYKRRPTSLYGADDYVEQHHIPDALLVKIERLIGPAPRYVPVPAAHEDTEDGRRIRAAGVERLEDAPIGGEPREQAIERAERLARLIVTDIALYNGDALDAAEKHGNTDELEARLRVDLEEGRLLFDLRVPEEVRRSRDFIAEALEEIRHQRRTGGGVQGT
jgi:CheY-like chemotaxis protein